MVTPAWTFVAWLSPNLWLIFFVQALRYQRQQYMGAFIGYAFLRVILDLNWAAMPTDPHAGIRLPLSLDVIGSVARCVVLVAAIWRVGAPDERTGAKWSVAAKAGIGLPLILTIGGLQWLGVVRVACFVTALVFDCIWLAHPYRSVSFSMIHMILLTVMLGAGAMAIAFYRVEDGHCVQGCRGDAIDTAAIAVQCACLVGWITLVSSPYFVRSTRRANPLAFR